MRAPNQIRSGFLLPSAALAGEVGPPTGLAGFSLNAPTVLLLRRNARAEVGVEFGLTAIRLRGARTAIQVAAGAPRQGVFMKFVSFVRRRSLHAPSIAPERKHHAPQSRA